MKQYSIKETFPPLDGEGTCGIIRQAIVISTNDPNCYRRLNLNSFGDKITAVELFEDESVGNPFIVEASKLLEELTSGDIISF